MTSRLPQQDRSQTEELVTCIDGIRNANQAFTDWLAVEMEIAKLPRNLRTASLQDSETIVASVGKTRGKKNPLLPVGLKAL